MGSFHMRDSVIFVFLAMTRKGPVHHKDIRWSATWVHSVKLVGLDTLLMKRRIYLIVVTSR